MHKCGKSLNLLGLVKEIYNFNAKPLPSRNADAVTATIMAGDSEVSTLLSCLLRKHRTSDIIRFYISYLHD